ncbi:MAG: type I restriction enzyme HsdR N-terminal domain-containing protein [Desulfobacteraceae bacterium]|nr:type I restriction enzyme HsdR N-terminal domain-containing protein [Desulfobacteraceae bacterium]
MSALGWDLEELDEVRLEYKKKPKDNPVDYALFIMRTPRLFIEAKSLEANLDDRKWVSQTLGYATVVGVEWCVLTNGMGAGKNGWLMKGWFIIVSFRLVRGFGRLWLRQYRFGLLTDRGYVRHITAF